MGSESGCEDEKPAHTVSIKSFLICRTECTQDAWDRIGQYDEREWKGSDHPIENVNWNDCVIWCQKAGLRLPTEHEWEYACRAGTTTEFYFGDSDSELGNYAWYRGSTVCITHPVGMKKPNAYGLYDMLGNVCEWCQGLDESGTSFHGQPFREGSWMGQSYRGGSWYHGSTVCRSANRRWTCLRDRNRCIGFRPAFSLIHDSTFCNKDDDAKKGDRSVVSDQVKDRTVENGDKKLPTDKDNPVFEFLKEETFSCGGQTNNVKIFRHEQTGLEFVLIPGGRFQMGSDSGRSDEKPAHSVDVETFLICRTEVTQGVWKKITGATPWRRKDKEPPRSRKRFVKEGDDYPVTFVNRYDCEFFCKKMGLRLPTEAEWEFACRAGTTTKFCYGDLESGLGNYAWFHKNAWDVDEKYAHRVGQKQPNAFGLYDVHGNVKEWCKDRYNDSYSGAPTNGVSWESGSLSDGVLRGGGWRSLSESCRSTFRGRDNPGSQSMDVGFRPAFSYHSVGVVDQKSKTELKK